MTDMPYINIHWHNYKEMFGGAKYIGQQKIIKKILKFKMYLRKYIS